MNQSILLVEDSKEVHRMVALALNGLSPKLDWAKTLKEALELLGQKDYELVLLDIELPDGNGLEFCSDVLKKAPNLTVFFLTSSTEISEKVLGFSAGADDYITKPFDPLELRARVEGRLRKNNILKETANILRWKEVEINKSSQEVAIFTNGTKKSVDLTSLEFKLLSFFAKEKGVVIERETLLNQIWGENVHVYSRSVDTHVSKLRRKLGPSSKIIESIHGVGYKFSPTENPL